MEEQIFSSNSKSHLLVPASIVVAGVIIAGAIVFTRSSSLPTGGAQAGTPPPSSGVAAIAKDLVLASNAVLGDPNAPITIVEFSDFECPYCAQFHSQTYQRLVDEYVKTGKVRFVYRHFPLEQIHLQAKPAAEAGECAREQGKFWDFHNLIFKNQSVLAAATRNQTTVEDAQFGRWAASVGVDEAKFTECLASDRFRAAIETDFSAGIAAGVSGTPTFFINDQQLVGAQPFSEFKRVLDGILARE